MYWLKSLPLGCFVKFFYNKKSLKLFFFFENKVYSFRFKNFQILFNFNHSSLLLLSLTSSKSLNASASLMNSFFRGALKNWIMGVGFVGVGFRFLKLSKNAIVLKLGLSHLLKFYFPASIKVFRAVKKPTKIFLVSSSKGFLTKTLSNLKRLKIPDNYKGKGLVLSGEIITIKKREKFGSF